MTAQSQSEVMFHPHTANFSSSSSGNRSIALGRWNLLNQLGSGATSKVFLAVDPATQQHVAIKIFTDNQETSLHLLKLESQVLKRLSHSNILTFIESYESIDIIDTEGGNSFKVSALVIEYASGGCFFEFIEKNEWLSENNARNYFLQLISALAHMHEKGIVHRDIKLDNILIDGRGNLKLADFGLSSFRSRSSCSTDQVGTSAYFAPEIHAGLSYSRESADLFAVGMTLFMMVVGHMPFSEATKEDRVYNLLMKNDRKTFWLFHEMMMTKKGKECTLTNQFKDLIERMIDPDAARRIKLEEIASHSWCQRH